MTGSSFNNSLLYSHHETRLPSRRGGDGAMGRRGDLAWVSPFREVTVDHGRSFQQDHCGSYRGSNQSVCLFISFLVPCFLFGHCNSRSSYDISLIILDYFFSFLTYIISSIVISIISLIRQQWILLRDHFNNKAMTQWIALMSFVYSKWFWSVYRPITESFWIDHRW